MTTLATAGVLDTAKYDLAAFQRKGATDYTDAFAAWVQYLADENAIGHLGNGDFYIETMPDLEQETFRMGIQGVGSSSRIILPSANTTGGIRLTAQTRDSFYHFADFEILREGGTNGVGIEATMIAGGARHSRSHYVRNVRVSTMGEPGTAHFTKCMDFSGSWHGMFDSLQINGPGIGSSSDPASVHFDTLVGLNLESAYRPTLLNPSIWSCYDAIVSDVYRGLIVSAADNGSGGTRLTLSNSARTFTTGFDVMVSGTTDYDGQHVVTRISLTEIDIPVTFASTRTGQVTLASNAEDIRISNMHIVNVWNGIRLTRPNGREPLLKIDGGHMNFVENGIEVDGFKTVDISRIVSYNEDAAQNFAGTPYDIWLKNVNNARITDNDFEFDGNPTRVSVKVENDGSTDSGDLGIMTGNTMTGSGASLAYISTGVSGWNVMGNNATDATLTGVVVNDIDLANIVQTDLAGTVMAGTWTPVMSFGLASVGITYGTQTGSYRISGKTMEYHIEVILTSKGTSTGDAAISLPTALHGPDVVQAERGVSGAVVYSNMASIVSPNARPISSTVLRITTQGTTATASLTNSNFTNTSRIALSGTLELG